MKWNIVGEFHGIEKIWRSVSVNIPMNSITNGNVRRRIHLVIFQRDFCNRNPRFPEVFSGWFNPFYPSDDRQGVLPCAYMISRFPICAADCLFPLSQSSGTKRRIPISNLILNSGRGGVISRRINPLNRRYLKNGRQCSETGEAIFSSSKIRFIGEAQTSFFRTIRKSTSFGLYSSVVSRYRMGNIVHLCPCILDFLNRDLWGYFITVWRKYSRTQIMVSHSKRLERRFISSWR